MEVKEAIALVKPQLTKARFDHTLRVAEVAVKLARVYGEREDKAELAAIFHDYAKYCPLDEMKQTIISNGLPIDLLEYDSELWHGPVGALLVEQVGITDIDIGNAIRYHTTGRANMSKLELIVFLADYIEPARDFPGLQDVRDMANKDLISAALLVSRNTIEYLLKKGAGIYPDAIHAYNDLVNRTTSRL